MEGRNLKESIFDEEFYQKLNKLNLGIRMRLSQGQTGARKSSAKGTSVEFSDFREYMLGDDIRRIDWNAYGRMDKLYIKQFMEEKEGMFHILLDCSKSMDFGEKKKSVFAMQVAAALSYVVLNNLDRVYLSKLKEENVVCEKGMTGKSSFKKIIASLEQTEFDGNTNLNKNIATFPLHGKGVTIIISDFLDPKGLDEAISYLLYRQQQIILIQILAREELEIGLDGTLSLVDLETKENIKITMSKAAVDAYEQQLIKLQNHLEDLAKKYGFLYMQGCSDESLEQFIFEELKHTGFLHSK